LKTSKAYKTKFQSILDNVPKEIKQFVKKQNEIAYQIYSVLKEEKISQKVFAKKINMKESQLSKILSGDANLTIKTITKIESALDRDIIYIPSFIKPEKEFIYININIDSYRIMKWSEDLNFLPFGIDYQQKVKVTAINNKLMDVA